MPDLAYTAWVPDHFIGGHPALDFANAVFDRRAPARDNELLKSARDVGNWLRAAGLATEVEAEAVAEVSGTAFVELVHEIRETSFSIFDALAAGRPPATGALGLLFQCAGKGLSAARVEPDRSSKSEFSITQWHDPAAIAAFLSLLTIEAFFTLPRSRLHACPRCGWLFVDTSRGGKRRWCSMRTCGNREKVSRYKESAD